MAKELMTAQERNTYFTKFISKELNASAKRIAKFANGIQRNYYGIAVELANVQDNNLYEKDGFKNAAEFAQEIFGIKKAQAYNLIRVGREFTTPELVSNIPHETEEDFTATQIIKLFPLGDKEKVVEVVEAERITPEMTCREITDIVRKYTKKDEAGEAEAEVVESEVVEEQEQDIKEVRMQELITALNDLLEVVDYETVCRIFAEWCENQK